jgi:hypothetical protein
MSIKYKIEDAKKNKNLINDEIKLSRIKSKGGNGDGGRKPGSTNKITLSKLSDKVDNLTDNLNKLAKIVTDGFERQEKFNTRMEKEVSNLRSDLNRIVKLNNLKH